MKSFLKTVRGLIHKLALVFGYIIIVAAMYGILLAALNAVAEMNKTKDNKKSIAMSMDELEASLQDNEDQWPYGPDESVKVKIHSGNEKWPYEITAEWWPELEKSVPYESFSVLGIVGNASISISDPSLGASAVIATQYFHVPDDILTPPESRSVEVRLSSLPQPTLTGIKSLSPYVWDTPILLEDVDFDGALELIVINHGQGQRGGHAFEVFDVDVVNNTLVATMKSNPPFADLDGYTVFDSQANTITAYSSGGACGSAYETYLITGNTSVPIHLVEYDYDSSGCYKFTYSYKNTDLGLSKVLLKKENVE